MKLEVLFVLLIAVVLGIVLSLLFSKKEKSKYDLSNEMITRAKSSLPNTYVLYSGEHEDLDTAEYKEIADSEVVKWFRGKGEANVGE